MTKITSVEPQKSSYAKASERRGIHRYNVFLDGKFGFAADEDLVVEFRLVPGKVIDQVNLKGLLFEAEVGKLMERMYKLWNIRPRSEKEVRNYFRIKGKELASDLTVDLVIKKLKQKGLLDDKKFAKDWVEARSKKYGKNRIRQELYQKGIDKEIVNEVIENGENSEQIAQQALEKKLRVWKNLKALEFKKKAYGYLIRRGFEYEIVKKAIEKYIRRGYN